MDWGLGHVSRTIPIIKKLVNRGHKVITCGNTDAKTIYEEEFKNLEHIEFKGYNPKYSKSNNQGVVMIKQSPKFFKLIKQEQEFANKIARKLKLDYIISDNRFGFRSKLTTNIFISHQINIQAPPLIKQIMHAINYGYIKKFNHCWIPDVENKENLAGKLSTTKLKNCQYIGTLSRFEKPCKEKSNWTYKYLGILSGPEPQRSILEKKIITEFNRLDTKCAIIQGTPNKKNKKLNKIDIFPHLKSSDFLKTIEKSETIICRSGYSSIMDLSILQKQAILVPTPGQTEQEYLGKYHNKISKIETLSQNKFSLKEEKNHFPIIKINNKKLMIESLNKCGL